VKLGFKKYAGTIDDFNRAIGLDSTDKVSYNRGLARYYINQFSEANKGFEKGLEINLNNSFIGNFNTVKDAYNNIADLYYAMNKIGTTYIYWVRL
jgi:tetratricopeptide (TPR) repeat protein